MPPRTATVPRSACFESIEAVKDTNVDIVGVPPIGGNHQKTWTEQGSRSPWLGTELFKRMPRARVLLYNHGPLHQHDKIEDLGQRLLNHLLHERASESIRRPLFFICHSTGGLVAKACLALASRAEPNQQTVLTSCYGIAFFATPHQGSSYLSAEEYASSIRHLLHLEQEIPSALREQFRPRQERLWHLSNQFKALSADMKVWSFLETVDSTLHVLDVDTQNVVEFNAPITSIRSGLLGIEHEIEFPMATDHAGTACFQGQYSTLEKFLAELGRSVTDAVKLSKHMDTPVNVESDVIVQINGFFENTALGVSDDTPLKLWSTRVSLEHYLAKGPLACLRERLGRTQPVGLDDSSLSSFDSPRHSFPHVIPSLENHEHEHEHEQEHDIDRLDTAHEHEVRPSRPVLPHSQSFEPGSQSPAIHITVQSEEYFEPHSESPPPPIERSRSDSITRTLGLNPLRSHRRSTSDGSSHTSGSRPSSSGSPQRQSRFLSIPASTRDRINEHTETQDIPRSVPRFDRPEPDTEKLLWIHVPYTHTGWVSQVIRRVCHDRQEPNFLRKFINDENWYLNLNRARHLEPHARYVRPKCIHSRQMDVSHATKTDASDDPQLALYTPYLHWDTYRNLVQRRKVVEDRLQQGRSRPVPGRIAKSSLEAQLIWQYLGCEPPIHFRRTLDQYGYPNLRSTVARDDDQMLWKRTRRAVRLDDQLRGYMEATNDDPEDPERTVFMDGNVLMVDQLWLWIIDQKTIVTFFPNQEATTSEGKLFEQTNLYSSIYNELNGDLARRSDTAGDLAALITLHAVTVLLDKTLHHDLQVLRIFEESISILTESVTKSFKRFRNRGFTNGPADYNLTADGRPMTATERNERDRKIAQRNREDLSVLLELRDIEDELATILKLLDQQDGVIKSMMKYCESKGCGKVFLDTAQLRIDEYRIQISEMKENSHLAQKAVETLLDLKQKQANVDEAKIARWQAEATQNQSRSVMVFTIFTVIFLPLSFFTSLFGINAREWSGVQANLSIVEMLEIAAPSSFAIIVLSLLLAFSEKLRQAATKSHKIGTGLFKDFVLRPIERLLHLDILASRIPSKVVSEDSAMRKRFDHYLGYESHSTKYYEDFWERREHERSPLAELERKARKNSKSRGPGESVEEKMRRGASRFDV